MAKLRSKKNKGKYSRYRGEHRKEHNKEHKNEKLKKRLEKRKAWRIKKFEGKNPRALKGTSIKLFSKWKKLTGRNKYQKVWVTK